MNTKPVNRFLLLLFLFAYVELRSCSVTLDNNPTSSSTYSSISSRKNHTAPISTSILNSNASIISDDLSEDEPLLSSESVVTNKLVKRPLESIKSKGNYPNENEHLIAHSEHEESRNVPTKPKYPGPGVWAKSPAKKKVPLEFVPTKVYAQTRGSHTVKRLPRKEAIKNAATNEEKKNAPRLREVVTNSKVNTVYTEEGYEDSAYDHAGHVRDADFHEGFAKKLHDEKAGKQKFDSGKANEKKEKGGEESEDYEDDYEDHVNEAANVREIEKIVKKKNSIELGNEWTRSRPDPKSTAVNEIQKLEEDVRREASEVEEASENNRPPPGPFKDEESGEDDDNVEQNAESLRKVIKEEPETGVRRELAKYNPKDDRYEKEMNSAYSKNSAIGRSSNSRNSAKNVQDTSMSFDSNNEATTPDYSLLLWNFFKANSDQPATTLGYSDFVEGYTAASLPMESQTNFPDYTQTWQTISTNGYIPENNENNRALSSNQFLETFTTPAYMTSYPTTLMTNIIEPRITKLHSEVENVVIPDTSTLSHGFDQAENSRTQETMSEKDGNKSKYKLLVRQKPKKFGNTSKPFKGKHSSRENVKTTKINSRKKSESLREQHLPTSQYARMLDYIKNQQNARAAKDNGRESASKNIQNSFSNSQRFVPSMPSFAWQPILPAGYPTIQSENGPEQASTRLVERVPLAAGNWPAAQQAAQDKYHLWLHNLPAASSPQQDYQSQLSNLFHKRNVYPANRLQPPLPVPSDEYERYRRKGRNDEHLLANPEMKLIMRYAPVLFDLDARTRSEQIRRRRSYVEKEDNTRNSSTSNATANMPKQKIKEENEDRRNKELKEMVNESLQASSRIVEKELGAYFDEGKKLRHDEKSEIKVSNSEISKDHARQVRKRRFVEKEAKNSSSTNIMARLLNQPVRKGLDELLLVSGSTRKSGSRQKKGEKKRENEDRSDDEHDELLNESPRASGAVIDREIETRFGENSKSKNAAPDDTNEIEVPNLDFAVDLTEQDTTDTPNSPATTAKPRQVDYEKYPFYKNENVQSASALRYAVNPRNVPRKSSRGMEFYRSRDKYRECADVEPSLKEVLPKKEEPMADRGPREDEPRLGNLGDKLDCFKAKYFDEDPFDDPLFLEENVEPPSEPSELDATKFASRILQLPKEEEEYIVQKPSRTPEDGLYRQPQKIRNSQRPYQVTEESIRVDYTKDFDAGRGGSAYLHSVRGSAKKNQRGPRRLRTQRTKERPTSTSTESVLLYYTTPYERQVYEDVMGHIKGEGNSYQVYEMTTLDPPQIFTSASHHVGKTSKGVPSFRRERITGVPLIAITHNPNNIDILHIKGLIPPRHTRVSVKTAPYRRNRQASKIRNSHARPTGMRHLDRYQKVRVLKRSPQDRLRNNPKGEVRSVAKRSSAGLQDASFEYFDQNQKVKTLKRITEDQIGNNPKEEVRSVVKRSSNIQDFVKDDLLAQESRRSSTAVKASVKIDQTPEQTQKVVYTIRDRIRYSKPKDESSGFGKFSEDDSSTENDSRRGEPRYNRIRNRKLNIDQTPTSTPTSSLIEPDSTEKSASVMLSLTTGNYNDASSIDNWTIKNRQAQFLDRLGNITRLAGNSTNSNLEEISTTTMRANTYAVSENVDEANDNATPETMYSTTPRDFSNLKKYLEEGKSREDSKESYEQSTSPYENRSSREGSASSEEHKPFFEFSSRPSSPAESYDDERYSDLGPRVNKPAFYHPPFLPLERNSSREEASDESSREKENSRRYSFPWHRNKSEEEGDDRSERKESKSHPRALESYEYPWDRRARLERERSRRKSRRNKFGGFKMFDEESSDEEEGASNKQKKFMYPWDRYDVPTKFTSNSDESSDTVSSESRAIGRRRKDNSNESSNSYPVFSSNNERKTGRDSSRESSTNDRAGRSKRKFLSSVSRENRRSVVSINPEDITQAPRRKQRRKVLSTDEKLKSADSKRRLGERLESVERGRGKKWDDASRERLEDAESQVDVKSVDKSLLVPAATTARTIERNILRTRRINIKNVKNENRDSMETTTKSVGKRRRRGRTPIVSTTVGTILTTTSPSVFNRRKFEKSGDGSSNRSTNHSSRNGSTIITSPNGAGVTRSKGSKERIVSKRTQSSTERNIYSMSNGKSEKDFPKAREEKSRERSSEEKSRERSSEEKTRERISQEKSRDATQQENSRERSSEENSSKIERAPKETQSDKEESNEGFYRNLKIVKSEIKKSEISTTPLTEVWLPSSEEDSMREVLNGKRNKKGENSEEEAVNEDMQTPEPSDERTSAEYENGYKRRKNGLSTFSDSENPKESKAMTTKAKFIKNPHKRLYYYVE